MEMEEINELLGELDLDEDRKGYLDYITRIEEDIQNRVIKKREYPAIIWLSKELNYQSKSLSAILERIRNGEELYEINYKIKSDGTKRETCNPFRFLKKLQRKCNDIIFSFFPVNENAFGFSRGNTLKAITPHLESKSLLLIDCKDAFPSVKERNIIIFLTRERISTYNPFRGECNVLKSGAFSWYTSNIISEIITRNGALPQGAPSSPIMFDIICIELDRKLSNLAKNVGGKYTRYADNIFFSFPKESFPVHLKHAILKIIEGRRRKLGPDFKWHKLQIRVLNKYPIRMLGLNIIDGKICNTRDYKRKIRIRIHHLNYLLDQSMDYKDAWQKLHGLISYAVIGTWPKKLQEDYKKLKRRVKSLRKERRHQKK